MLKVSNIINGIIGSCSTNPGFLLATSLSSSWSNIVGLELFNVTSLSELKYTGKNKITVIIKVVGAASLLAKYSEETIKNNIEKQTNIKDVKVVFKQCFCIGRSLEQIPITNQDIERIQYSVGEIFENKTLQSALDSLKTEMQNAA